MTDQTEALLLALLNDADEHYSRLDIEADWLPWLADYLTRRGVHIATPPAEGVRLPGRPVVESIADILLDPDWGHIVAELVEPDLATREHGAHSLAGAIWAHAQHLAEDRSDE